MYPPENLKDIKKISGLLNFSKIRDKILAKNIADDIHHTRDKYGNQKKISIQHYLVINIFHKILTSFDENDSKNSIGVLLHMINWAQAFDRMSQNLEITSFMRNRKTIPNSYFDQLLPRYPSMNRFICVVAHL